MFKKGEIYWCNFDNNTNDSDAHTHVQLGFRPILVISRSDFNKEILLVAPLTTREKSYSTHIKISRDKYTNLRGDSYILLEQIRSIDVNTLGSFITQLDELDIFKLDTKLNMFLNLFNASENKFARDITKTVKYICKIDEMVKLYTNESILFDEDIIHELINKREKKIKCLTILCEKFDIDIKNIYKEPVGINEILDSIIRETRRII